MQCPDDQPDIAIGAGLTHIREYFDILLTALGARSGACIFGHSENSFLIEASAGGVRFDTRCLKPRPWNSSEVASTVVQAAACDVKCKDGRVIVNASGQRFWVNNCNDDRYRALCFDINDGTIDILVCSLAGKQNLPSLETGSQHLLALWQKARNAMIGARPAQLNLVPAIMSAVLEAIPAPAMLVREDHSLAALNDMAAHELREGKLIGQNHQLLTTSLRTDTYMLSVAISGVLNDADGEPRTVLATDAGTGQRRVLEVRRFDLSRHTPERIEPLCIITMLPKIAFGAASRIAAAYGLTLSERRLVARLATGKNIKEAAEAIGIKEVSARTYVKRIFTKMGISRQSQLVSLLSSQGALLRHEPNGHDNAGEDIVESE